jgi:hypothetical protein
MRRDKRLARQYKIVTILLTVLMGLVYLGAAFGFLYLFLRMTTGILKAAGVY